MKVKFNFKVLTVLVLIYPILLGLVFLFNIPPFPITAPYFFLVLFIVMGDFISNDQVKFKSKFTFEVILSLGLLVISLANYSSIRYSMPILFTFYIFLLQLYIITKEYGKKIDYIIDYWLFIKIYVFLSLFFLLFLDFSHMEVGDRFMGFTGSPTTYAAFMVILFILKDSNYKNFNLERVLLYILVFWLVYLSKTRLLLVFLIVYPVLLFVVGRKGYSYGPIFITFFSILFFVYPLYSVVIKCFPELVTLRYEDARDASFGLRMRLYQLIEQDFYNSNYWDLFLGKGNEYSRLLVESEIGQDILPHNDFLRILDDWGILGGIFFFVYLYRISKRNITSLMISLCYLILFYSNMVFNLFIISILMLSSFCPPTIATLNGKRN